MIEFFRLNDDLSEERLNKLIGKHAIISLEDKDGNIEVPAKIISYDKNKLFLSIHNDGTDETNKEWINEKENLFKEWEEWVEINKIKGIQEYDVANQKELIDTMDSGKKYIITNLNNNSLEIEFITRDLYNFEFYFKTLDNKKVRYFYPIMLIKKIKNG